MEERERDLLLCFSFLCFLSLRSFLLFLRLRSTCESGVCSRSCWSLPNDCGGYSPPLWSLLLDRPPYRGWPLSGLTSPSLMLTWLSSVISPCSGSLKASELTSLYCTSALLLEALLASREWFLPRFCALSLLCFFPCRDFFDFLLLFLSRPWLRCQ